MAIDDYLAKWLRGQPCRFAEIRHDPETKNWVVKLSDPEQATILSKCSDTDLGWAIYMATQKANGRY